MRNKIIRITGSLAIPIAYLVISFLTGYFVIYPNSPVPQAYEHSVFLVGANFGIVILMSLAWPISLPIFLFGIYNVKTN